MWAAYQGDAISVDILLKHSADPSLQDEKGMTALHWGVVKANKAGCHKNQTRYMSKANSNA
jgi:palmitoyltransferase ZDHHC13/17